MSFIDCNNTIEYSVNDNYQTPQHFIGWDYELCNQQNTCFVLAYVKIEKEITALEDQNNKYDLNATLIEEHKKKTDELTKNQLAQEETLEEKLNSEMARLNSLIFGENSPAIHFESTKSYTFSSFMTMAQARIIKDS